MANVTAGAAYKELTKVGDYISPNINAAADRLAKQGMQQKQLNADAKAREEAREEVWNKSAEANLTDFEVKATGNTSRDDMFRMAAGNGVSKSQELFRQARELRTTDRKGADLLKDEAQSIGLSFKNLANDSEIVKGIIDGYAEDYKAGKIKENSYRSWINGLSRNEAELYLDDNNNWIAKVLVRDETSGEIVRDENGEATYIEKSIGDVKKGLDKPYYFNEVHGKDGELNKVLTAMGKNKYDEVNDQYIDTKQEFGVEQEKSLQDFIKGTLGSDREMYKWYNYATGKEKFKDFNSTDKGIITDYINNAVKGAYGKETSTKVAPRTAEQIEESQAKDRALTKRGQDLAEGRAKEDRALKLKQLALDEYKAKNPNKTDKMTKTEEKESEDEAVVLKFYELAKEVSKLPANADESEVQKVYDESGLGFLLGGDLDDMMGFGNTEYDIKGVSKTDGVQIKDVFKNVKGMAKAAGLTMNDVDIKSAIHRLEKSGMDKEVTNLTPEEQAAKAQELIDKYSTKN